MNNLSRDIRYALRTLAKSPGFAAVAILTLALGIGANTAIFTVANTLLFRPLPYADPSRLELVAAVTANQRDQQGVYSFQRFTFIHDHARSFSGVAAFTNEVFNLTGRGDPEQVPSARVSANFFDVLGVRPEMGRTFLADEDVPGGKQVALISHGFWARRFGSASDAVGQSFTLDSREYTVIGVLPAGFVFPFLGANVDIWAPRVFELNLATPQQIRNGAGYLTAVARLAPGVTREQAQAEMDVLDRQYRTDNAGRPDADPRLAIDVGDLHSRLVANIRIAVLILLGAVGFVLLIACANVASLLLSRALGRKKEIAIRAALGAERGMLLRQLLTESLILAMASGILGVLLSQWGTHVLSNLTQTTIAGVHMDGRVLCFSAAISLASGILFGMAPALQLSKPELNSVLRDEGRGSIGSRRKNNSRNLLVVAQVALSMILLVGSGLLIRSFIRLQTTSPGFDPKNVLTMRISLPPTKYADPQRLIGFYKQALQLAAGVPGIQAAAISSAIPTNISRLAPILAEGQPAVPIGQRPILNIQTLSPDYTKVLRVQLLRGRDFTERDDAQAPAVVIVNQTAVRRFWPNENPIGKHVWLGTRPNPCEVVGVFGDVKNAGLAVSPNPEVFIPFPQLPWALLNLSVRTTNDPRGAILALRKQLSTIDPDQPVTNVRTMEDVLESASAQPRFMMLLLGVFSATALILAVVGIYGVIAYTVAQRTPELGIRIALGAARGDILRLVIGHGLGLTLSGILIGLVASLAMTRLMSTLLYDTSATDPITFLACALAFTAVAMAASYIPARRAMRIDPTDALR